LILVEGLPFEEETFILFLVDNKNSLARTGSIEDILILHLFFTVDVPYKLRFQFRRGTVSHCRRYIPSTLVLVMTNILERR